MVAVVQRFVDAGISVDMATATIMQKRNGEVRMTGVTPLHAACYHGRYHGASRHAVDSAGNNALTHACVGASPACVSLVLGTKPPYQYTPEEVNRTGHEWVTALALCTMLIPTEGVDERCIMLLSSLLIAAGADLGMK